MGAEEERRTITDSNLTLVAALGNSLYLEGICLPSSESSRGGGMLIPFLVVAFANPDDHGRGESALPESPSDLNRPRYQFVVHVVESPEVQVKSVEPAVSGS